jgi:hypothetical protein
MNLPITKPILNNVFLDSIILDKLFIDFSINNFSGLLFATNYNEFGFEESYIVLEKGKITGCIYLFEFYDIKLYGAEAFNYCLNCLSSKNGVLNIYELNEDQIKLILLFNDKINYIKTINIKDFKKKNFFLNNLVYDINKIKLLLKEKIITEESQKYLLDQRGLDDLLNI